MNNKLANYIYASIFLVLTLLLSTPNFSVVVIVLLFITSLVYLIKNKEPLNLMKVDLFFIIACSSYFLAFIPVAIIEGTTLRYFDAPLRFLIAIPIYLVIRHLLINDKLNFEVSRKTIEYGAIAGSFGSFIISLYQVIVEGRPRVDGFLYSINFGYLACSLAFLCLVLFKHSQYKPLNLLGFIAATVATLLTGTRGAIFAIPILLIITLFLHYREKLTIVKVIVFAIGISGISTLFYQLNPNIKQRIDFTAYEIREIARGNTATAESSGGRIQLWEAAIEAFKGSPIVGETYHNREIINQKIYDNSEYKNEVILVTRAHAHSQYFEILASAGLIGLSALLLYLIMPLAYCLYLFSKNRNNIFALAGCVFTTGICIFALTEVLLEANLISAYYAFMQAILIALASSYHNLKIPKSSL